jgi:hypothetical protein
VKAKALSVKPAKGKVQAKAAPAKKKSAPKPAAKPAKKTAAPVKGKKPAAKAGKKR